MSLQSAPLVMVWREVSDLANAEAIAAKTLAWPEIGRNDYAIMYDAGNVIASYWVRPVFQREVAAAVAGDCPADASTLSASVAHNPASEFLVLARDFMRSADLVGATVHRRNVSVSYQGDSISLVDGDGNYASFLSPSHPVAVAKDQGSLFHAVVEAAPPAVAGNAYAGHKFLVSNLDRSVEYYQKTLGLELILRGGNQAVFNCGPAVLVLQLEPASGLVRSLARAGRLASDGLVFYAPAEDVDGIARRLTTAGVTLPRGVKATAHGPGAEFFDPDGHKLGIWAHPAKPGPINYFPALYRILAQAAVTVPA